MSAVADPIITSSTSIPETSLPRRSWFIVSIFPMERRCRRRHNRPVKIKDAEGERIVLASETEYVLPACPRGTPYSLLEITDSVEYTMEWSESGPQGSFLSPKPIPALVIAQDIANAFAKNTVAGYNHNPGIAMIQGDRPTELELAQLHEQQTAWFRVLIQDAQDFHTKGDNSARNITDIHRNAAFWMMGKGAERLSWYNKLEYLLVKNCPSCGEQINQTATGCKSCGIQLALWYDTYGIVPTDEHVKPLYDKLQERKAQGGAPVSQQIGQQVRK